MSSHTEKAVKKTSKDTTDEGVAKAKKEWKAKLKSAGLEEKRTKFSGHKDFSTGMNIDLIRKDKSKVGKLYKYKDDGYDEETVLTKKAVDSQISYRNYEDKSGMFASTGATSVAPDLRGKGIGGALVKYQEALAREAGAEEYYITNVDNPKFWDKMGYKPISSAKWERTFVKKL